MEPWLLQRAVILERKRTLAVELLGDFPGGDPIRQRARKHAEYDHAGKLCSDT